MKLTKTKRKAKKAILAKSILEYELEIAEHITNGVKVFIKDTGTSVEVDKIEKRSYEKHHEAQIRLHFPISKEAFKLLHFYSANVEETVRLNKMGNPPPNCYGTIRLKHLSTSPYETKASKILHKK